MQTRSAFLSTSGQRAIRIHLRHPFDFPESRHTSGPQRLLKVYHGKTSKMQGMSFYLQTKAQEIQQMNPSCTATGVRVFQFEVGRCYPGLGCWWISSTGAAVATCAQRWHVQIPLQRSQHTTGLAWRCKLPVTVTWSSTAFTTQQRKRYATYIVQIAIFQLSSPKASDFQNPHMNCKYFNTANQKPPMYPRKPKIYTDTDPYCGGLRQWTAWRSPRWTETMFVHPFPAPGWRQGLPWDITSMVIQSLGNPLTGYMASLTIGQQAIKQERGL